MLAHPRHTGELGPMGDLVEREPQTELVGSGTRSVFSRRQDVGSHVVDDVLVLGTVVLDHQQVVLTEHPGRHPAQHRPDLGAGHPAHRRCHRPADPTFEPVGHGPEQSLERRDVGADPAGSVGDPSAGGTRKRAQAGLERDQFLGLGGESLEVRVQRGVVIRGGERFVAADPNRHALGHVPVDQRMTHGCTDVRPGTGTTSPGSGC